ncbi:MAG: hypothetical protein ACFFCW_37550 [Candidatus Hodarchaeota archaeon]
MQKKIKKGKTVYRSMEAFEKAFFPVLHKKKLVEQRRKDPSTFGTGIVPQLIENMKQKLMQK